MNYIGIMQESGKVSEEYEMKQIKGGRYDEGTEMGEVSQDPMESPRIEEPFGAGEQQPKLKKSCLKSFTDYFNTEEYWPVMLGLGWYFVLLGYSFWGLQRMPTFYPWTSSQTLSKTFTMDNFTGIVIIIGGLMISVAMAHQCLGRDFGILQYLLLQAIVFVSSILGTYKPFKTYGLSTSVWGMIFGMILRMILRNNTIWLTKHTYDMEFFIKFSVALLAVNFNGLGEVGERALMISWVDTLIIFPMITAIGVFLLRIPKEVAITTSAGVSICGSGAAMVVGECVQVKKELISILISILAILTIPCIPALPLAPVNDTILGVWIGGSLDNTGAVLASAAIRDQNTAQIALIIKMLQNLLIAPIAVVVTFIWNGPLNFKLLWRRLPKSIIGFMIVVTITTLIPPQASKHITNNSFIISQWLTYNSFVLIGFEVDLCNFCRQIKSYRMVLLLYIIGQLIDLATTFGWTYLFFYVIPYKP